MKILIDARLYGLENAGLGRYVMNLVTGLSSIDFENNYSILLRKKYFENVKLPENWKKIKADFGHYSFSEQLKLRKIIKTESPDLVHFPHFNVPVLYRGKYVVTIHDLLMHKQTGLEATTLIPPLYFLKRLGYKTVFRNAVFGANKIIVPSMAVRDEVEKYYHLKSDKIEVINEGVEKSFSSDREAPSVALRYGLKNPYFIYAGNAYPHKNLNRLIESIVALNRDGENKFDLVIVSSRNVFTSRLQKTVTALGAENYVKLLGFVPDKDLRNLYGNSLAFVFPSISEGFGLPGLEAMMAGALVMASNIPVFKEIYGENAIYFNPFDFTSIERVMKDVFSLSRDERSDRIKKSQKFVKKYTWEKMCEETLKVYTKILAK